jgi:hypothetical protein
VEFREADMFQVTLPSEADVFLMAHVLHDWDETTCRGLLRRCHDALPANSPLLVMEFLLDEEKMGPFLAAIQWLWLVLGTTGDQRTGQETSSLLAHVGFLAVQTMPVDDHQSIVMGWKR